VGRTIHSVHLQPSGDNRIKLRILPTTDEKEVGEAVWKEIGSEIIRYCQLGDQAERVGLTVEDMRNVERHFIIKPSAP
jgi:hypothetical protein